MKVISKLIKRSHREVIVCCDKKNKKMAKSKDREQKNKKGKKKKRDVKGETDERASEEGQGCVGDRGGGELDELTPGSRVSQGASMQGMLPVSPWYWLVSRPGIRLAHPRFYTICG